MPRLLKVGLVALPVPAAFAFGFICSRYLLDRDFREAETALSQSIANYELARARSFAQLDDHYAQIQQIIDRLEREEDHSQWQTLTPTPTLPSAPANRRYPIQSN